MNISKPVIHGTCTRASVRFSAYIYGDAAVDEAGEPDLVELRAQLRKNRNDWDVERDPYFCQECGDGFRAWARVQEHWEAA